VPDRLAESLPPFVAETSNVAGWLPTDWGVSSTPMLHVAFAARPLVQVLEEIM
jgi:hypothetical protein